MERLVGFHSRNGFELNLEGVFKYFTAKNRGESPPGYVNDMNRGKQEFGICHG